MNLKRIARNSRQFVCVNLVFLLLLSSIAPHSLVAQANVPSSNVSEAQSPDSITSPPSSLKEKFRVETLSLDFGAELLTIFAKLENVKSGPEGKAEEVPLVSVLRDTLGDDNPENDRLRYVWMLTYTEPSFWQKFAATIPFVYTRAGNKSKVGPGSPPPPVIDLHPTDKNMWNKVFWILFQNFVLDKMSLGVRSTSRQYRRNASDHRKVAIARALALLSLYEQAQSEEIFTETEMRDIQARMLLTDKLLGSLMDNANLQRVYQKNLTLTRDYRGHNWELLRQYVEKEGLYFEPLTMPDSSATHALVWVAVPDLQKNKGRPFEKRFLNIESPWNDRRLWFWDGYSEIRWFDTENRPVDPDTPGAIPRTMIPLALYGLDYPKIPILLVDFRNNGNVKRREMSKRILDDITGTFLRISKFGNIPYFVGRYIYDFVTSRRGMDVNQASRLRSYSQLKMLISLNESLNPKLRDEISDRVESVSLNPMENDLDVEVKIAKQQYENLIAYAKRSDGLAKKIEGERREEMTRLKYSSKKRMLFALGHLFSLGLYTHRETQTPELRAQMEMRRRLDYHERYLREVARVTAKLEVDSDVAAVRRSLEFVSQNGSEAQAKTAQAVAKLFSRTDDEAMKQLCLSSLYRINNSAAKKELLALFNNKKLDARWRDMSAQYLRLAVKEEQRIAPADAKAISKAIGQ
jgi:hypothetical protein